MNADSRKQSVSEINSIIQECQDKVVEIINNKNTNVQYAQTEPFLQNCEMLLLIYRSLLTARAGITNLKFTYIHDHNTVSQLDIMLLKIDNILKETLYKFNYYNKYLPENRRIQVSENEQINQGESMMFSVQEKTNGGDWNLHQLAESADLNV